MVLQSLLINFGLCTNDLVLKSARLIEVLTYGQKKRITHQNQLLLKIFAKNHEVGFLKY